MFSRVNPLGWALFEELTSAQMNLLDLNASRAIDGTFGGTYNPSEPININGTMTVTNMTVTNLTTTTIGSITSIDTPIINCIELNCSIEFNCLGNGSFDGIVFFNNDVYFAGTSHTVHLTSGGTFDVSDGVFRVSNSSLARFESDVDFASNAGVVVQTGCSWDWYNVPTFRSGFNAYSTINFYSSPAFQEGLTLIPGKQINYSSIKYFTLRWPFGLGGFANNDSISAFYQMKSGKLCQVANSAPTFYSTMHQGLAGGTTFNITQVDFRCRALGLSGSTVGPTTFELLLFDQDMTFLDQKLAYDDSPNSSTAHNATWIGGGAPLVVDPNSNILGIRFDGYQGGDTLNDTTKWYELLSCRLTCSTMAMGVY